MRIVSRLFLSLFLLSIVAAVSPAQYVEDVLRLSTPGSGIGARSLGMGMSFTAVANDFSAVYWNPAGLGQIKRNEVSFGLSHLSYDNNTSYLGNSQSFSNSSTGLNGLGLVYAFPTTRGALSLAFGYGRSADFTTGSSFRGFNANSSIIPSLDFDLAYELYLVDSLGNTPLQDSMQQIGKVIEGGGVNNWVISGAVEAAPNFFLGATLNFISGSYTYNRDYDEVDIYNKYSQARYGVDYALTSINVLNTIEDNITGFTTRLGLLYKFNGKSKVGLNIKIPTFYTISEDFASDGYSRFDVPDNSGADSYSYRVGGKSEYEITTPFVFSGGIALGGEDIMLTGDVEFTDWTQMKFGNTDPLLESYNTDIKTIYKSTLNFHGGAEFSVPATNVALRGGFAYLPSPYRDDPTSFDQKYITAGLGFLLADAVALDFGYAYGYWDTYHINYYHTDIQGNQLAKTAESIHTNTLTATLGYRF